MPALYDVLGPLYDGEYDGDLSDVPCYQALAAQHGGPVLELGCGSGRVLAELVDPDWAPLFGLDASPVLLERARRRLERHPVAGPLFAAGKVRLVQGDMADFSVDCPGGFGLVIVALNSFLHLTEPSAQASCLAAIARHLAPQGALAMEVFNPERKHRHPGVESLELAGDFLHPETGERVQRFASVSTDLATQTRRYVHLYDTLGSDGTVRRLVHEFSLRYLYRFELELMLERAGLVVEAVHGGYGFEPFTGEEDSMVVVAVRR